MKYPGKNFLKFKDDVKPWIHFYYLKNSEGYCSLSIPNAKKFQHTQFNDIQEILCQDLS